MAGIKDRKAPFKLSRLGVFPLTKDDETTVEYGTAYPFAMSLMTASTTPNTTTASLDADDQQVEQVTVKNGGSINIGLTALNEDDEATLYGKKIVQGTVVSNKDDITPSNGVAYMTGRSDGKVNLYKYPKVKFAPGEKSNQTQKSEGLEFSTITIAGNYIPTIFSGDDEYIRYAVDPVADKAIVDSWFTEGDYFGPVVEG